MLLGSERARHPGRWRQCQPTQAPTPPAVFTPMPATMGHRSPGCTHMVHAALMSAEPPAPTQRIHSDAGRKVEILVAIDVVHLGALASHKNHIRAGICLEYVPAARRHSTSGGRPFLNCPKRGQESSTKHQQPPQHSTRHSLLLILNDLRGKLVSKFSCGRLGLSGGGSCAHRPAGALQQAVCTLKTIASGLPLSPRPPAEWHAWVAASEAAAVGQGNARLAHPPPAWLLLHRGVRR